MLSRAELLRRIDRITVWKRGSERAPHKPLLILYALGRLARGDAAAIPFREAGPKLAELLEEFGPARRSHHPEYPFWRLQNDGLWQLSSTDALRRRTGQTDVPRGQLLEHDVHARFPDDILETLQSDSGLLSEIARRLLAAHFPDSIHEEILAAVGLSVPLTELVQRRRRDAAFRGRVLAAYEHACAVCGLDVRIGARTLGLEAAHIQWHQAGGPDEDRNGLALCSLQHKAFDLGAYTIQPDGLLLVSQRVHGSRGFHDLLLQHHGRPIRPPQDANAAPAEPFLHWHERQVFKPPPRES